MKARSLALYARVSTGGQTVENQRPALVAYAERRGEPFIEYADEAVSGKRDRRPALDQMMQACRRREVCAVVVTKLDRLGRSLRHLADLAEELEKLDIALVVLDQAIDTSTASGRLLFGVIASVAAFERELIVERTHAGLERARRQGKRLGRAPKLTGEARLRARRMWAAGQPCQRIATTLGVSRVAVRFACKNIERREAKSA